MDEETELALRKAYGGNGDIKYWRTLQQQVSEVREDFQPDGLDEYNKKEAKEFNTRAFEIIRDLETFFKIDFDLFIENFSDPTEDYLFKNPAGFFPVLNTSFNENIVGSLVIVEYLQNLMLPPTLMIKKNENEIRRLLFWFETNFKNEIILPC